MALMFRKIPWFYMLQVTAHGLPCFDAVKAGQSAGSMIVLTPGIRHYGSGQSVNTSWMLKDMMGGYKW